MLNIGTMFDFICATCTLSSERDNEVQALAVISTIETVCFMDLQAIDRTLTWCGAGIQVILDKSALN